MAKDPKIGIKYQKYPMNEKDALRQYVLEICEGSDKWDIRILTPAGKHGEASRKVCHRQSVRSAEGANLARRLSIKWKVPEQNVLYVNNANDRVQGLAHDKPKDQREDEASTAT